MTELIGDICVPSELIVPTPATTMPTKSGALYISGAKLCFYNGSAEELISSA